MHGGQVDPFALRLRLESVFDFRRPDPDIVVMVRAPERVDPVRAQRHAVGRVRRGAAERRFERYRPVLDQGRVRELHVPARAAGIAAHGAAVLLGGLVVLQHGLQDEGGKIAVLDRRGGLEPLQIILRNLNGGLVHQGLGGGLDEVDGDHSSEFSMRALDTPLLYIHRSPQST